MDKKKITLVVEYAEDQEIPAVSASTEVFGGKVVGVSFGDALEELEIIDLAIRGNRALPDTE